MSILLNWVTQRLTIDKIEPRHVIKGVQQCGILSRLKSRLRRACAASFSA